MADNLRRFIVIKSVASGGYAYYKNETEAVHGCVCCQGKTVFSPFAKIEVEAAKSDRKYVHLRFCHSNKYWTGRAPGIVAGSDRRSKNTLFEPTFGNDGFLYLTHVQSGRRVRADDGGRSHENTSSRVYLDDKDHGNRFHNYAFTFVDCDDLVKIPKRVAFIGDNGKYLQGVWYDGTPWKGGRPNLQFSGSDGNHEYAAYEIHLLPDGHVRIKSEHFGKFWRRSPNWIWGDSTDESGEDKDTWFWPVRIDDRTIALRNAGNNHFCSRLTTDNKVDCLNAAVSRITREARLVVEELILERKIYNVRYRMEDARIFDEQPFVAGTGTASNQTDKECSLSVEVAYEYTCSHSFTNSWSLTGGVKTTFQTGLPFIVKGQIEVSVEVTKSWEWGDTTEVKTTAKTTYTVPVPPKSRVTVNYVGTRGKCSVPFSYTRKDKISSDGHHTTSQHIDGIFNGVDYYNFDFEQLPFKRL